MIKQIYGERGSGKTYRLMEFAEKNNAIFVCNNVAIAKMTAEENGFNNLKIISYSDYNKLDDYDTAFNNFVIDEIDSFLEKSYNILAYSFTIGDR